MIPANETFNGTFPFKPNFFSGRGFKMHYVDEGEGEPVICLHGQPTWGYLYRHFIPYLSRHYRVIVPDYMGYGKSETPKDKEYSFKTHVENLAALIEYLDLKNITIVCQDWGGPITGSYALRYPDRIKRLCLMNTMLGYGGAVQDAPSSKGAVPRLTDSSWFQWVVKAHKEGYYRDIMSHLGDHVLSNMKKLNFTNSAAVTPDWIKAYSLPFSTPEETIAAVEFPLDAALNRIKDYVVESIKMGNLDKVRNKPAMLAEGMEDKAMPPALVINDFRRLFPNGPIVELDNVGHFCQEDAPQALTALIHQFIQMT